MTQSVVIIRQISTASSHVVGAGFYDFREHLKVQRDSLVDHRPIRDGSNTLSFSEERMFIDGREVVNFFSVHEPSEVFVCLGKDINSEIIEKGLTPIPDNVVCWLFENRHLGEVKRFLKPHEHHDHGIIFAGTKYRGGRNGGSPLAQGYSALVYQSPPIEMSIPRGEWGVSWPSGRPAGWDLHIWQEFLSFPHPMASLMVLSPGE